MKLHYTLLTILALAACECAMSQNEVGRMDYFNRKGERAWSSNVYKDLGQQLFSGNSLESGWQISGSQTISEDTSIGSMKFTLWGTEKYDMDVESEVPVDYSVKSSQSLPARIKAKSQTDLNFLCGDTIIFTVELPEGSFPSISWHNDYTYESDYWNSASAAPLSSIPYSARNASDLTDPVKLKEYIDRYVTGHEIFTQLNDKPGKNRWSFEFVMPNEPCSLTIGYSYADSKLLRQAADYTLYGTLYTQYQEGFTNNSGEAFTQMISNLLSQDYIDGYFANGDNTAIYYSFDLLKNANAYISIIPWMNSYFAVMRANMLLDNLNLFTNASPDDKEIVRAQMLALRAHSYSRILQCYGKRWSESDNGAVLCAPLILSCSDIQKPLSSMKEIYAQVEADLLEAEKIFRASPSYKRSDIIQPDLDVALALKTRLYILGEEWQKAREAADEILKNYPLSSNEDIASGFFQKRKSWIWGASANHTFPNGYNTGIYYWCPQNCVASNGNYGVSWQISTGAIDRDLYVSIPETDVRRAQFAMPDQLKAPVSRLYGTLDTWYNSKYVDPNNQLFLLNKNAKKMIASFYAERKPDGVINGAFDNGERYIADPYSPIPFGAQVKFLGTGENYGYDTTNDNWGTLFLRSDEVLLSAAEAAARMGDEAAAIKLLTRLNPIRDAEYSCSASGQELIKEIQHSRRVELWGEGHSWFDFKRWNLPIKRNHWVEGNTESGNWPSVATADIATSEANGWQMPIPAYYLKQNPAIDISKMGYTDEITGYTNPASLSYKAIKNPFSIENGEFRMEKLLRTDKNPAICLP